LFLEELSYYIHCFTHLKRDVNNGDAPHKPILLLSIISLFQKGILKFSVFLEVKSWK